MLQRAVSIDYQRLGEGELRGHGVRGSEGLANLALRLPLLLFLLWPPLCRLLPRRPQKMTIQYLATLRHLNPGARIREDPSLKSRATQSMSRIGTGGRPGIRISAIRLGS